MKMSTYEIEQVNINDVVAGDYIEHNGVIRTVCKNDIKKTEFMGRTIFGDSYHLGYKLVKKVRYIKPFK